MSKNDDPLPKFPIWIKIVWALTLLSLSVALILCLMALKKPKVESSILYKYGRYQEPFLYAYVPHFYLAPKKTILAVVTAYNPVPEQTDDTPHITASGERVREGIVANNCLPFGTIVEIGGRSYVVLDRMNRRYGCHYFDILMFSYREAIQWGVRKMQVKIYH